LLQCFQIPLLAPNPSRVSDKSLSLASARHRVIISTPNTEAERPHPSQRQLLPIRPELLSPSVTRWRILTSKRRPPGRAILAKFARFKALSCAKLLA
jgi:hypothetical protein